MEYLMMAIFWIVIIGAAIAYIFVKKSNNRKDAQNGADKARVQNAAELLFGDGEKHRILYAHWEKREHYGRTTKITYFRYAVIFQDQTICVAPLYIDKNTRQIQVLQPKLYTPENLGKIEVKTRQKDGVIKRIEIWLGNKKGQTLEQFYVDAENLRSNRYFPVNLEQQEECAAFERFITPLAQRIDAENPGVDALIQAYHNENTGMVGAIISGIGAFSAFFFPPMGMVLSLVGLVLTGISKAKGATGKKPLIYLIISIVAIILSAVFMFGYISTYNL